MWISYIQSQLEHINTKGPRPTNLLHLMRISVKARTEVLHYSRCVNGICCVRICLKNVSSNFFSKDKIYKYTGTFFMMLNHDDLSVVRRINCYCLIRKKIALMSLNFWIEFIFCFGFLIPFKTPYISTRYLR